MNINNPDAAPQKDAEQHLLLIEDDPGDAHLIQWYLRERGEGKAAGYTIKHATSLRAGADLAAAEAFEPEAILLDLNLPDSSGIDTVGHCRDYFPDSAVVVLTGLDDYELVDQAIEAGAEDYLVKGGSQAELRKAVRFALLRHRREAETRLARRVFRHAREGIMVTEPNGRIVDVNPAFSRITGYTRDEAIGRNASLLRSEKQGPAFYQSMWRRLAHEGYWEGEIWNRRKDGEHYPEILAISAVTDSGGRTRQYIGMFTDITLQKQQQQRLERMAHYDALTNLANRDLFSDRLAQAMARTRRHGGHLAVLYLDLDGFKQINDEQGHDAGDMLLRAVAERMATVLRDTDTLARIGGDEFTAVIPDLADRKLVADLTNRLLEAAARPVEINGTPLSVTASCGVTFFPQTDQSVCQDQLLRQADQAMYQAKQAGRNQYCLFDEERDQLARSLQARRQRFSEAIEMDRLALRYQPEVHIGQGRIISLEALVRWPEQFGEEPLPESFLPDIAGTDLPSKLDEWILRSALTDLAEWRRHGLDAGVSINLSSQSLQRTNFFVWLQRHLRRHPENSAARLTIEVSESDALSDLTHMSEVMAACANEGVNFALDNFGTGYSSLSYLRALPARKMKIDARFTRNVLANVDDLATVEGALGLARAFRRNITADGVASVEQGRFLSRLGIQVVQGDAIAAPMPADQVVEWGTRWAPDPDWQREQRVQTEHRPLLFAEVEHRAWVEGLKRYLDGEEETPPKLNPAHCRFGRWLQAGGSRMLAAGLDEINRLHLAVHRVGERLVEQRQARRLSPDEIDLSELNTISDRFIRAIWSYGQQQAAQIGSSQA